MDKRRKRIDDHVERALRDDFHKDIAENRLSIHGAVKAMRRISRLTQAEFAKHRGISLPTLKLLESGKGNPKVETINKVAEIFGLRLGFVKKPRPVAPIVESANREARLAIMLKVKDQAEAVFGDERKAMAWLGTRNPVLGDKPWNVMENEGARGAALVSKILSAIAYGAVG